MALSPRSLAEPQLRQAGLLSRHMIHTYLFFLPMYTLFNLCRFSPIYRVCYVKVGLSHASYDKAEYRGTARPA